ncbi:ABC transporter permease subunit [Longispora sp. NPDC051575]|uniref:ABC transporter permease n=1 Tax=Longispora sp. NPDC051575 TaxID=3154943 RepID=UPI003437EE4E
MRRALPFLVPAVLILAVLVLYPIGYTLVRSFFDAGGGSFVGVDNYRTMFTSPETLTAIRNNAIWVVVAPTIVTVLGLLFAVLTERMRWQTAFKAVVFMPMAISFLAAGVTWRMVYDADPDRGLANAAVVGVHDAFAPPSDYPGVRPRDGAGTTTTGDGNVELPAAAGTVALVPLVGLAPDKVPSGAVAAAPPDAGAGVRGVVWLDFATGGGGRQRAIDPAEKGLPGISVEAVRDGKVVGTAKTDGAGRFAFPELTGDGYTVRLPADNFAQPFRGVDWLGPAVVTPAVIGTYLWIWAGFAMVMVAAGLAALPRDTIEAARMDGASEWQVLSRITVPQLRPVLIVVLVTMVINVLKVFDLVLVLAPEAVQADANVVALQMWRVSFGGARDYGLGSALGVLLFLLVLPAMLFNLRRLKREGT